MRYALGLLLVVVIAFGSAMAAEQKHVALVIGNANYGDFGQLKNPVNDAIDISSKLDSLGFEVITLIDANKRKMKQGIRNFTRKLGSNSVALFYFAGHGVEIKGRNYLVPVNADIQSEADVEFEAVDAGRVLAHMGDSDSMLKMAILDACRNNPFNSSFRSATRGLVRMNVPTGTLLMYATRPGDVAADGEGRNGVFTQHFLASLDEPGLEAYGVFKRTATQVFEATNKQQTPYFEGFVTGDFVFNRAAKNVSKAARQTTASNSPPGTRQPPNNLQQKAELLYWESVAREDSTDLYRNATTWTSIPTGCLPISPRANCLTLRKKWQSSIHLPLPTPMKTPTLRPVSPSSKISRSISKTVSRPNMVKLMIPGTGCAGALASSPLFAGAIPSQFWKEKKARFSVLR